MHKRRKSIENVTLPQKGIDKNDLDTYNKRIVTKLQQKKEAITGMSEEQKKLIDETVENLKHLNKESLLIVKGGTEMLKARDAMSAEQEQKTEQEAD